MLNPVTELGRITFSHLPGPIWSELHKSCRLRLPGKLGPTAFFVSLHKLQAPSAAHCCAQRAVLRNQGRSTKPVCKALTWDCRAAQFRFMMLSLAAMEAPLQLEIDGSTYGQDCVFVANDWHAALVPVYLAAKYRPHGVYQNSRSIVAIHNLRHQARQHIPFFMLWKF